jgi:hypothetical protein
LHFSLSRAKCPSRPIVLWLINRICFGEEYKTSGSSLCRLIGAPERHALNSNSGNRNKLLEVAKFILQPQGNASLFGDKTDTIT